jgi:hypothetical protein
MTCCLVERLKPQRQGLRGKVSGSLGRSERLFNQARIGPTARLARRRREDPLGDLTRTLRLSGGPPALAKIATCPEQ